MRGDDVHVAPVLGELALELGDLDLAGGDLRLHLLELARASRLGRPRLLLLRFRRRGRLGRCGHALVAAGDVVGPAAVVRADRAVLDRQRAVGDRIEQGAIVRDQEHGARKRLERGLECFTALDVEMVRRLVEEQEVGAGGDDDRQREPTPFAARQHAHRLVVLLPAGEEEAAEEVLGRRTGEPGHRLDAGEHGAPLVELDLVLREVAGLDAVPQPQLSSRRLTPAEQRLEQGRLAGAVRPDESDVLAPLDRERDVGEQLLVAGREVESLSLGHGAAASLRLEEVEAELLAAASQQRDLVLRPPRAPSRAARSA